LYKTLVFLGFIFIAAPISLPTSVHNVNKKQQEQNFKSKFEKAYELKTYDQFERDFFEKFEKVSKKWYTKVWKYTDLLKFIASPSVVIAE